MQPSILVLTPEHHLDPKLAVAASRFGALGVLDLGYQGSAQWAIAALSELAADHRWGLRWSIFGDKSRSLGHLQKFLPSQVPWLIVANAASSGEKSYKQLFKSAKVLAKNVAAECYSLADAMAAQAAGFNGVVLKGSEAGGHVGTESAFLLLQRASGQLNIPYWIHGGIGPDTAAAASFSGAGIVLAEQLWLAEESPFSAEERLLWQRCDGSETALLSACGRGFRVASRINRPQVVSLEKLSQTSSDPRAHVLAALSDTTSGDSPLVPLGQHIGLAAALARKYVNVAGILRAHERAMQTNPVLARKQQALAPNSKLAESHGTEFPIVQGPMTRVSDVAPFCHSVAKNGALPFLALALLRGAQVGKVLAETQQRLGTLPWGVGILGFVPPELRQEQLAEVLKVRPKFAIIAGGRPSQATDLEREGIQTYLHVPSPDLLASYIEAGAKKFIFEGRECGGHVGPRASFPLWQSVNDTLLSVDRGKLSGVQILYAGGIHDELSSAMVAVLASPLVEAGVKIGVLMGTAYLFTPESIQDGAILPEFQQQAIACQETALLDSGYGHATRCANTQFAAEFQAKKKELLQAGKSSDEVRLELEMFNIGRLRVASKGVARAADPSAPAANIAGTSTADPNSGKLIEVDVATQRRDGLYMIGQLAALKSKVIPMRQLHEEVTMGAMRLVQNRAPAVVAERVPEKKAISGDLAIVGMSCVFPDAASTREFWQNIVRRKDSIKEVPENRFDTNSFFSANRLEADRFYSRWGGFLGDMVFDPMKYRIPPASLAHIEPVQLMSLEVAWRALDDAGYHQREFPRERTSVVFGVSGPHDLGLAYGFRTLMRHFLPRMEGLDDATREKIYADMEQRLPTWSEDSFPGFLNNVIAGRVSNHLDLRGANFVVDAACAAALAALQVGMDQLRSGACDVSLVGAADATNNASCFMSFAKTHALSPRGRPCPFDEGADGIALGEGVAAIVLRRLEDAQRDGDRIYAVIKGIGASSDGRNRSLTAPHPPGQMLALRRAYENAGLNPATTTLVEAHGTGTAVGDRVEVAALQEIFTESSALPGQCAIGSVKSMIGHSKTTAGLAGLIKTVLAIKQGILPPTLNVSTPNKQLEVTGSPLYVNCDNRPWLRLNAETPRRAGVSAFGFGGTNFHVVLEEYTQGVDRNDHYDLNPRGVEAFAWSRPDRDSLLREATAFRQKISAVEESRMPLAQAARSLRLDETQRGRGEGELYRLAIIASDWADLRNKLDLAIKQLPTTHTIDLAAGLFLAKRPTQRSEQIAVLFPGQGSQSVDMLKELVLSSRWTLPWFETCDRISAEFLPEPISRVLYPTAAFTPQEQQARQTGIHDTRAAQPALAAVNMFAWDLLGRFGVLPGAVAGHSFGEYTALCAAGVISKENLARLAAIRGQLVAEASCGKAGGMVAVFADKETTQAALKATGVACELANMNTPDQTIIAGPNAALEEALKRLPEHGLKVKRIPVSAAFHTQAMSAAANGLAAHLNACEWNSPALAVFSNTTAAEYPSATASQRALLIDHIKQPVQFAAQIEAMHQRGLTTFVECGPGSVLTGMVQRNLKDKPHVAVAMGATDGWKGVALALAKLFAFGVPVRWDYWFEGRGLKPQGMSDALQQAASRPEDSPTAWLVDGASARPIRPLPSKAKSAGMMPASSAAAPTPAKANVPTHSAGQHGPQGIGATNGNKAATHSNGGHTGQIGHKANSGQQVQPELGGNGTSKPGPASTRPVVLGSPAGVSSAATGMGPAAAVPQRAQTKSPPNASNISASNTPKQGTGQTSGATPLQVAPTQPARANAGQGAHNTPPAKAGMAVPKTPPRMMETSVNPKPAPTAPLGTSQRSETAPMITLNQGPNGIHPPGPRAYPVAENPMPRSPDHQVSNALADFQANMSRWLEMQQEQQRVSERFLHTQERILLTLLGANADAAPPAFPAGGHAQPVPPTPMLPPAAPPYAGQPYAPFPAASHAPMPAASPLRVPPTPIIPQLKPTGARPAAGSHGSPTHQNGHGIPQAHAPAMPNAGTNGHADYGYAENGHGENGHAHGTNGVSHAAAPLGKPTAHQGNGVRPQTTSASVQPIPQAGAAPPVSAGTGTEVSVVPQDNLPPPTEDFRRDLLDTVSARTGYPIDMLDEDLPFESGLGIDSIKTVEIFSQLRRYYTFLQESDRDEEEILAAFTQLKTLRHIIEGYDRERSTYVSAKIGQAGGQARLGAGSHASTGRNGHSIMNAEYEVTASQRVTSGSRSVSSPTFDEESSGSEGDEKVQRYVLAATPVPLPAEVELHEPVAKEEIVLVLGEIPALSEALQPFLTESDNRVRVVLPGKKAKRVKDLQFEADFNSPASLAELHALVCKAGVRVGGIINLLGFSPEFSEPGTSAAQAACLSRWVFNAAKEFGDDLKKSIPLGSGLLVNVSAFDGRFGLSESRPTPVHQAGILGMFKSLRREWPGLRVKLIDLNTQGDPERLLTALFSELASQQEAVEVGLSDSERVELALTPVPYSPKSAVPFPIQDQDVILVTGGALGITADICRGILEHARPRLILVGRTPWPQPEPEATARHADIKSLREHLIRSSKTKRTPAELEKQIQAIVKDRNLTGTVAEFTALGAEVDYVSLDVRDSNVFGKFIDSIYERYGRIDGVIHGAGIVEDRSFADKTEESFLRVFETKVKSAETLAKRLHGNELKFLALFSSVVGRFGNAGQIDYAAANEYLNKLANELNRGWKAKVVAINWGPWDAGMVNDALRSLYSERGVELIPRTAGIRRFLEELRIPKQLGAEITISATVDAIARVSRAGA